MKIKYIAALVVATAFTALASAQESATGFISLVSQSGAVYNYDMSITNTGTTTLGTVWYSWNPGQNYLPTSPTATSSPTGWGTATITHDGAGDGYGIRWIATTLLASGATISGFDFSSTDSPSVLAGNTSLPLYTNQPVGDSFVYSGAPFSDAGYNFVINPQAVPAPNGLVTSLSLFGIGIAIVRKRTRS